MTKQVQIQFPSGEVAWAEVAFDGPSNVTTSTVMQRLHLDDLRNVVRGVAESMRLALDDLRPDEVAVEFGVELAVKSGKLTSVLAEASGKATVKVTVGWHGGSAIAGPPLPAGSDTGDDESDGPNPDPE